MSGRALLCLVTDRHAVRGELCAAVREAVSAGVDRVQIRERELGDRAALEHARAVADAARRGAGERGGTVEIIINRRVDIAIAIQADGVHLGFDAMSPADARALLGPDRAIGVSTHAAAEVASAPSAVDYAHLAPIFDPLSKASERPALGTDALARAAEQAVAVIAQGGISADNAGEVLAAGASGVAVTGSILLAESPGRAAGALRDALDSAIGG
jgi:thiamine-phosphate pyrophosphorylase